LLRAPARASPIFAAASRLRASPPRSSAEFRCAAARAPPGLGALLVTVLSNGMNLLRIDGYIHRIILGVVIFLDRLRRQSV
jgi:hypothetical protein